MNPVDRINAFADSAACRGQQLLFTADARDIRKGSLRALQQICASCPVAVECAEYAEEIKPTAGVWAGRVYERRGVRV